MIIDNWQENIFYDFLRWNTDVLVGTFLRLLLMFCIVL